MKFPNKGVVDCGEEGVAIVKGALKGQRVRFVVSKKRSEYSLGRLREVEEKSEIEDAKPLCPHFGMCGGCAYQTLSYENQLELKSEVVKDLLDNAINDEYEFEGIIGSPNQWAYRNKMEFSFGDEFKEGPLALGMHKKESFHDIVTVDECKIVDEDYNKVLRAVLDYCANLNLPFYHKMRHEGYLRHLLVRRTATTNEMLVALVTSSQFEGDEQQFIDGLKDLILNLDLSAEVKGILHIINDGVADIVQSDETRIIYGDLYTLAAHYEGCAAQAFKAQWRRKL